MKGGVRTAADDTRSDGVPGMPGVFHFAQFRCVLLYLVTRMTLPSNVLFYYVVFIFFSFFFFIPISAKTYTFESMSGKLLSRNALKSVGVS